MIFTILAEHFVGLSKWESFLQTILSRGIKSTLVTNRCNELAVQTQSRTREPRSVGGVTKKVRETRSSTEPTRLEVDQPTLGECRRTSCITPIGPLTYSSPPPIVPATMGTPMLACPTTSQSMGCVSVLGVTQQREGGSRVSEQR